mmetsp:Transcript_1560/g.3950  ORF Transcript_1560/g.3950 Transcript_1560/m.3950 type:complete len:231 (-) Transcript_1560:84-776(-)
MISAAAHIQTASKHTSCCIPTAMLHGWEHLPLTLGGMESRCTVKDHCTILSTAEIQTSMQNGSHGVRPLLWKRRCSFPEWRRRRKTRRLTQVQPLYCIAHCGEQGSCLACFQVGATLAPATHVKLSEAGFDGTHQSPQSFENLLRRSFQSIRRDQTSKLHNGKEEGSMLQRIKKSLISAKSGHDASDRLKTFSMQTRLEDFWAECPRQHQAIMQRCHFLLKFRNADLQLF